MRVFKTLCISFIALNLSGCGFQPVYAPTNGASTSQTQQKLLDVKTEVLPKARSSVLFSNALNYKLNSGSRNENARYLVKVTITTIAQSSGLSPTSGLATNVFYSAIAKYDIIDSTNGKTIYTGKTFSRSDYDATGQRFANHRAAIDAENRAIALLAENVHHHLIGYFSQQKGS